MEINRNDWLCLRHDISRHNCSRRFRRSPFRSQRRSWLEPCRHIPAFSARNLIIGCTRLHAAVPPTTGSLLIRRTAIPVFMGQGLPGPGHLHPVTRWWNRATKRKSLARTILTKGESLFERARELHKLGVGVIICGAVSDAFFNLLRRVRHRAWSAASLATSMMLSTAYRNGALAQARFRMPGSGPYSSTVKIRTHWNGKYSENWWSLHLPWNISHHSAF